MSDFLRHLASRAVSPVPAVRPLIRSPYEPQAGNKFELPEALPIPVILESQPLPTAQLPASFTTNCESEFIEHALRSQQPVAPPRLTTAETPRFLVADPVQVAAKAESLEKFPPSPLVTPVLAPALPPQTKATPTIHPVSLPVQTTEPRPADRKIPVTSEILLAAVTGSGHLPSVIVAHPSLRPQLQSVSPISARPLAGPPNDAPASQSPPQVTVTIGRVEIRAAASVSQAPSPAPNNAPRLSLDTYLRQRASRST